MSAKFIFQIVKYNQNIFLKTNLLKMFVIYAKMDNKYIGLVHTYHFPKRRLNHEKKSTYPSLHRGAHGIRIHFL